MTNRKNQNSILFLTTLGVYFGLLLVGGTPCVLAQHAATTKGFELKDEIEVRDDLDKKPKTPVVSDSVRVYLFHVESFLERLHQLRSDGKFSLDLDIFEVSNSSALPCVEGTKVGFFDDLRVAVENLHLWKSIFQLNDRLSGYYAIADCLPSDRFDGKDATFTSSKIQFDQSDFAVEVRIRKSPAYDSGHLLEGLRHQLKECDSDDNSEFLQQVVAGTSFRAENDQVVIVTRLPRAGLDLLLAKDAK